MLNNDDYEELTTTGNNKLLCEAAISGNIVKATEALNNVADPEVELGANIRYYSDYEKIKKQENSLDLRFDGYRPIHLAVWHHQCEIIELLIKHKVDVNAATGLHDFELWPYRSPTTANTCLHLLAGNKTHEEKTLKIVELLLKNGANVNATNVFNATPLHIVAYESGLQKVAALLLQHNANPEAKDFKGNHPDFYAAQQLLPIFKKHLQRQNSKAPSSNGGYKGRKPPATCRFFNGSSKSCRRGKNCTFKHDTQGFKR